MAEKKSDRNTTHENEAKTASAAMGVVMGGGGLAFALRAVAESNALGEGALFGEALGATATTVALAGIPVAVGGATYFGLRDDLTIEETKDINNQSDAQVKNFEAGASKKSANLKEMAGRADIREELARRGATFNGKNNNDLIFENPNNLKILADVLNDKEAALQTAMKENKSILPRSVRGVFDDGVSKYEGARSDLAIVHAAQQELKMQHALVQAQDSAYHPKKDGDKPVAPAPSPLVAAVASKSLPPK